MYSKISSETDTWVSVCPSLRALSIMPCGELKRSPGCIGEEYTSSLFVVQFLCSPSFFFCDTIPFFFLRYNSAFNRNCSSLSHTFPNHQRLVQSKVNLLEYKNRLCRHETGDRLFQLAFFFGSLEQLQEKVFTPRSLSCLVCNRFFNMEASTLHVT